MTIPAFFASMSGKIIYHELRPRQFKMVLPKILLVSILLATGCTTYIPSVALSPVEGQGSEVTSNSVVLKSGGIDFECDFLQSTDFDLLFEVAIHNDTEKSVAIDPQAFQFFALDPQGREFAAMHAYDPEELVFEIEEAIETDKKVIKRNQAVGWFFVGLNVISAVSSFSDEQDAAGVGYTIEAAANVAAMEIEKSQIKKHIVSLEGERDYYEYAAIRKTVLQPGETLQGLVIYPRLDEAARLIFEYEIGRQYFEITYDQKRY